MAGTIDAHESVKADIRYLTGLMVMLGLFLFAALSTLLFLNDETNIYFTLGVVMAVAGFLVVMIAVKSNSNAFVATGATLQFTGGGVACMWNMDINSLFSLVVLMAFGPLALMQYEIGACVLTVNRYMKEEGTDFAPALRSLRQYITRHLTTIFKTSLMAYLFAVLMMVVSVNFLDLIAKDSLVLMGLMLGLIIVGAGLLLFLKGGKVAKEEAQPTRA